MRLPGLVRRLLATVAKALRAAVAIIAPQFGWRTSWHRLLANMFEAFLASIAILTAVLFFVQPQDFAVSPIGRTVPWGIMWNAGYGLAALATLIGLLWFRRDVEMGGLLWLAGALLIHVIALLVVRGRGAVLSVSIDLAFAASCLARVWSLLRGRDVLILANPKAFYG